MNTVVIEGRVRIPDWVKDLDSFRQWADSDDLPEKVRIWYLKGEVWVYVLPESISHNLVYGQFACALGALVKNGTVGLFLGSGFFMSNSAADIAGIPDGTFVSRESLKSGRARLMTGSEGQYNELEGSPDVVLEILTPGSVHKDTVLLRQGYWEAGVREYWLVDPRGKSPRFNILRHTAKGFIATRARGGWLPSAVFGKAFRLTKAKDELGHPEFTLVVR